IKVQNGMAKIPEGPGLGIQIDWDTVEQFRIEPIAKPYPHPDLLIQVVWPSGAIDEYAHGLQYWDDFMNGRRPVFSPKVDMKVVPNDGSEDWNRRYQTALAKPAWVMRPN